MIRALIPLTFFLLGCGSNNNTNVSSQLSEIEKQLLTGADQLDVLLPIIKDKRVALTTNYTAVVGKKHLVDTLLSRGVNIVKIFAPEHGFRGDAADGQKISDSTDAKTGVRIYSLYGASRKPTEDQLKDVDVMIFDIQDVGARFYTYISTMHRVMESCAENGKPLIVLDRPNPNGSYVDGPVREPEFKSFVGMHPIPIVHGLTVGELAKMISGEGWLELDQKLDLTVIPVKNWKHADLYHLPIRPSPNLPNDQAIALYPSLCLFEQTVISVGRGTDMQFQVLGNPELTSFEFSFTPVSMPGFSINPPQKDKKCYGIDLRSADVGHKLDLSYLIQFYKAYPDKDKFFLSGFERLAGTKDLRNQIKAGLSEQEIRASWEPKLSQFKEMRKKYLIYP